VLTIHARGFEVNFRNPRRPISGAPQSSGRVDFRFVGTRDVGANKGPYPLHFPCPPRGVGCGSGVVQHGRSPRPSPTGDPRYLHQVQPEDDVKRLTALERAHRDAIRRRDYIVTTHAAAPAASTNFDTLAPIAQRAIHSAQTGANATPQPEIQVCLSMTMVRSSNEICWMPRIHDKRKGRSHCPRRVHHAVTSI
jgi:hypothetical protein